MAPGLVHFHLPGEMSTKVELMQNRPIRNDAGVLEVIVSTLDDALEAEKGGAGRLEIIRDVEAGGYTPPLDLVRAIRTRVGLPLRVMLREEAGFGLTEVIAAERLCCFANELGKMNVDGVVLGFLHRGHVDLRMTRKVLSCTAGLRATFHHAFEDAADKLKAIDEIKQIDQVDRILSHGGWGTHSERIDNLDAYSRRAGPDIRIIAGGRVDLDLIKALRRDTDIREFHVGTAARENGRVSSGRVALLAEAVKGIDA